MVAVETGREAPGLKQPINLDLNGRAAMKNNKNETQARGNTSFFLESSSGLRGRQSVRATFRLSEACIDAISIVATHLGIKQKSIFEWLNNYQFA